MSMPAQQRGNRWGSIQGRFALLLLMVFVPVLAIQAYLYYDTYQTRRAWELQANLEIARAVSSAFDSFIQSVLNQELSIGLAIASPHPRSSEEINRVLKNSRVNSAVRDFTWMDLAGNALFSSNDDMIGRNYGDRSYFREVFDGSQFHVSELIFAKTTGQVVFGISRGIRDDNGALIGVMFAAIIPEKLDTILGIERSKTAGVSLLDSKGMHVFRWPKTEFTWEQRNWLALYPVVREALEGKELTAVVRSETSGKNRYAGFAPVSKIGWTVTASRSEEDITAPILAAMYPHGIYFLITLSFALFSALALSRPLVTSISRLRDHALALGLGRMDKIQISGPSEIQDLSDAFNRMTEEVKLREAALRRSELRLRRFYESGLLGVIYWNMNGKITDANDKFLEMVGYTREDLQTGRIDWLKMTPLEHRHLDEASIKELRDNGVNALPFEKEYIRKDGTRVPVIVAGAMLDEARFEGVAFALDITDRTQAAEGLRQSEERLSLAVHGAGMGTWDEDCRTGRAIWSRTHFEMLGYPVNKMGEATQEMWRSRVHPDDLSEVTQALETARSTGSLYAPEHRIIRADTGEVRWLSVFGRFLRDDAGETVRFVGIFFDTTDRKKTEEELRRLNANLEQTVQERTGKLRRLASELTLVEQRERKNLSRILHDGMQQFIVAAKMQLNSLHARIENLGRKQEAREIERLLDEAVQVSRTLAAELSPPILRDSGILAGLEWLSRWKHEKYGLKVQLVMDMDAPTLAEDVKILLFECVREMLLNVVKHAQTKSVKIHLFQAENNQLGLTVSDNGKGFEVQAENPGCPEGFGLFSIQERLSVIGGTFQITSAPGKGCRITLTAPLGQSSLLDSSKTASETQPAESTAVPSPASAGVSLGKVRILIVDDHIVMREGLARLLAQEADFDVIGQATNGQQAIERATLLQPALILMDISMPVLDGIEATKIIHKQHPHIHIIGLSLYTEDERAREMLSAGASFYMSKSSPPSELKAAIRSCCGEMGPISGPSKSLSGKLVQ